MALVGPCYLSRTTLPYASDIFYHKNIRYFLPTGFHPIEMYSVLEFPNYCSSKSIALPNIIWKMCNSYFQNSKDALESYDIIEPLKEVSIKIEQPIYSRNEIAIVQAKEFVINNPKLLKCLELTLFNLPFISRELLSHILFEIYIERGFNGVVEYIYENSNTPEKFFLLITATIINRLKLFESDSIELLLYDYKWLPLINTYIELKKNVEIESKKTVDDSDDFIIEHMSYKIFEKIIDPIFGACNTKSKSGFIAEIARTKQNEIEALKKRCRIIATNTLLMNTNSSKVKQEKLSNMISEMIIEPLSDLTEKPSKDLKSFLSNFLFDSTVIGGALSFSQQPDPNILGLSVAAGAISTVAKHILQESQKVNEPSNFLLTNLKKMRIKNEDYENKLRGISLGEVKLQQI